MVPGVGVEVGGTIEPLEAYTDAHVGAERVGV